MKLNNINTYDMTIKCYIKHYINAIVVIGSTAKLSIIHVNVLKDCVSIISKLLINYEI